LNFSARGDYNENQGRGCAQTLGLMTSSTLRNTSANNCQCVLDVVKMWDAN